MSAHQDWVEGASIGISALCIVHCLALPMTLALLPSLSALVAWPESLHLWLLAFLLPMAALVLVSGYRMHREALPLALGVAGMALLGAAVLFFPETVREIALTTAGSVVLIAAHWLNWKRRHGCRVR